MTKAIGEFHPTMKKELMDKLQRLRQGSVIVKEYRQQMEVLLLRVGLRQEERTSIATFLSGLNMKVRDKILILLDSWQEAFGGPGGKHSHYYWAYEELKVRGFLFLTLEGLEGL